MLTAVGIASLVSFDGLEFALHVQPADALAAQYQLQLYEAESRSEKPVARRHSVPARSYPHAWIGCLLYVAVLVAIGYAVAHGLGPLDAFERGELDAGRVQSGQWWRAWTALTLHLDAAHLAANLGAGVWFGYLAGRQIGSGTQRSRVRQSARSAPGSGSAPLGRGFDSGVYRTGVAGRSFVAHAL